MSKRLAVFAWKAWRSVLWVFLTGAVLALAGYSLDFDRSCRELVLSRANGMLLALWQSDYFALGDAVRLSSYDLRAAKPAPVRMAMVQFKPTAVPVEVHHLAPLVPGLIGMAAYHTQSNRFFFWKYPGTWVKQAQVTEDLLSPMTKVQETLIWLRPSKRQAWNYRVLRTWEPVPGQTWKLWFVFQVHDQIAQRLVPALMIWAIFAALGILAAIPLTRRLEQSLRSELSDLENHIKVLKTGQAPQPFEGRATTLGQIMAELLNQLVSFFNQNLEQKEVEHQRDTLTGLYTRKYLMENMERDIKRAKRYQHPLSFIMIDIDHFKKFNDTYGHLMGDHVLRQASQLIRENTREVDLVARYGGEEIAVVLSETPLKQARLVAEKLRVLMEKAEFTFNGQTVHVTISLGLTSFLGGESDTLQAIVQRADEALYEAKNSGRNQVRRKI